MKTTAYIGKSVDSILDDSRAEDSEDSAGKLVDAVITDLFD